MVCSLKNLENPVKPSHKTKICLPTGKKVAITHVGEVKLKQGLKLKEVLYVPDFEHNLISVSKLVQEGNHNVIFNNGKCLIQDCHTGKVEALGKLR